MKKIIVAFAAIACLAGCVKVDESTVEKAESPWSLIDDCSAWGVTAYKVVEIEGHSYVVVRGGECISVIHAESCPCRK